MLNFRWRLEPEPGSKEWGNGCERTANSNCFSLLGDKCIAEANAGKRTSLSMTPPGVPQGVKKKQITKESSTFPRHHLRFNVLAAIWKRRSTAKLRSSNHLPYPTSGDVVEQDESPAAFGVSKVSMWSATKIKRIITA